MDTRAVVAVALTAGVLVAGCGSNDDEKTGSGTAGASTPTEAAREGKPVDIAYLGYTLSDFPQAQIEGAESVVGPAGGSVKVFNANFDPQKQVSQCLDAVNSGRYNALIYVPLDPATGVPCARAAEAAGIPVGTIETAIGEDPYSLEPQVPGVVAVVASPLESEVEADAQLVEEACGSADPCKVIAEVVTPNDPFTNDVVDGVEKRLGDRIEVVQRIASQYDLGVIAKAMPDALSANPDVDVFFAASDQSALAAVPAIKDAGLSDQVKVTGRGGSGEGAKAVRSGDLVGTTGNWPKQYGAFIAEALTQAVNGETVAEPSLDMLKTDTPTVVTAETVDEFEPEWGAGS